MSSSESITSLLTINIVSLYVKPEPSLTVNDNAAHRGGRERPGTFSPRASRPLAVRPFPFAIVPAPSPLSAPSKDSLPVRGRAGGPAATSAKVLILDQPLPAVAPRAVTPIRGVDDGSDDDIRPSVLVPSVGAWTVGRGCAARFLFIRLALPLPPPMTVVNLTSSADDSAVDREVSLGARDRACTVHSIRSRWDRSPWLYFSPTFLQLAEKQDLEIL